MWVATNEPRLVVPVGRVLDSPPRHAAVFRVMSIGSSCVVVGSALLLLFSGCVMRRTVTEDGVVVNKGYVIKDPL